MLVAPIVLVQAKQDTVGPALYDNASSLWGPTTQMSLYSMKASLVERGGGGGKGAQFPQILQQVFF